MDKRTFSHTMHILCLRNYKKHLVRNAGRMMMTVNEGPTLATMSPLAMLA